MDKKYTVTQAFVNELVKWRDHQDIDATNGGEYAYLGPIDIDEMPQVVSNWWTTDDDPIACNNRLVAIINWLNGEDVFEVEAPHKFVVRNDTYDNQGDYWYVKSDKGMSYIVFYLSKATKFDTREEAQEWANSHQVIIEIDSNGDFVNYV